jgi:hypothetical protein
VQLPDCRFQLLIPVSERLDRLTLHGVNIHVSGQNELLPEYREFLEKANSRPSLTPY